MEATGGNQKNYIPIELSQFEVTVAKLKEASGLIEVLSMALSRGAEYEEGLLSKNTVNALAEISWQIEEKISEVCMFEGKILKEHKGA